MWPTPCRRVRAGRSPGARIWPRWGTAASCPLAALRPPRGRQELVTLVYTGPEGPVYFDHPAEADPAGTWRADDGGEFPVESYRPLFAFRTKAGLEVAVRWSGAEGEAMDLYRQEGNTFLPFVAASW